MADIEALVKGLDNCECGRKHICPIDYIKTGHGVLDELGALCEKFSNILLISDTNTWNVCANKVHSILNGKIAVNLVLEANGDVVIPNEEKIAEIQAEITDKTDLIIGVGSGVINDLCKYVSYKNNLDYYIVATAPSMDGYASVGAALILEGMKITLNARPPKAIVADSAVLKDAPIDMLRAGYGDIIGKYSCLNDWKLSALINGEYFCQSVYDLTYECAQCVEKMAEGVSQRDEETIGMLMNALVTVGIAMSYVDCSRPASGSEHHLSHFFEITGILDGKEYFAHGIDVVFSSVVTAQLREAVLSAQPHEYNFDENKWEQEIRRIYSSCADGVIALQKKLGWYERNDFEKIKEKLPQIKAILSEAPASGRFIEMIEKSGLDFSDFEKMYGKEKIEDAILYAKDLKDRYSVLWLYLYFM